MGCCANKNNNSDPPIDDKDLPPKPPEGNDTQLKSAVLVVCDLCKDTPDIDMKKMELPLIDVHYCEHVNILKRVYFPQWKTIQFKTEMKSQ